MSSPGTVLHPLRPMVHTEVDSDNSALLDIEGALLLDADGVPFSGAQGSASSDLDKIGTESIAPPGVAR